jgi:uncharacterized protein with ATP-grasp and redox domains
MKLYRCAMLPPTVPLPDSLRANEVGTFAEHSVVGRLPEIALRAIAENDLDANRVRLVEGLAAEIATANLSHVDEPAAPDAAAWAGYIEPRLGTTWVDAPWFFVETYFYRRLLAATGYSQPGTRSGVDPFTEQKQTGLNGAMELAAMLGEALHDPKVLLGASLWANRVDLSLWPAGEADADARTRTVLSTGGDNRLLVDDTDAVLGTMDASAEVHLVLDNAGAELVADLALVAGILRGNGKVIIHAKPHPTFVSDTTPADIEETLQRLASEDSPGRNIASKIAAGQANGTVRVETHPFWVSPLAFWQCPQDLDNKLGKAGLIVVKGDANYRRLLGDRHWNHTTPISEIIRPPAPLVALRTSKAEVAAGLSPPIVERATAADSDWMTNGHWGMIQYAPAVS